MKPALRAVAQVRKSDSHPEAAPECRDLHPGTPTSAEVEKLLKAAGKNRWGHHDATMILVAFRHGLRASEPHGPALGSDRLLLRHLARPPGQERHPEHPSDPWRRNARAPPATARAGAEVAVCVHVRTRIAVLDVRPSSWNVPASGQARLSRPPAHACGFALANKGHDTRALQAYLGHRNIQHTVRYTELSADRFKDFWKGRGRNDRHRSDSRPLEQHHSDGRPLELPMTVRSSNTGFIVYALRVRL